MPYPGRRPLCLSKKGHIPKTFSSKLGLTTVVFVGTKHTTTATATAVHTSSSSTPPLNRTISMVSVHRTVDGGGALDLTEDSSKKVRKPYTITKSRESWTEQEHDKFLEALQLFDRDWKKIEAFIGSKTVIQIRSHAQKYFLKVQKNGTSEHVPPPRPKRKAAHPYPQKASKCVPPLSQPTSQFQSSFCLVQPGYGIRTDSSSAFRNSASGGQASSWAHNTIQTMNASHMTKDHKGPDGAMPVNNCCSSSSTESHSRNWCTGATEQGNDVPSLRVMPDFSQVYSFIGSVFDPGTTGHLEKLKEMESIDVETVLLLMKNLSVNLTSPDFEDHRRLLSSYDAGAENMKSGSDSSLETDETVKDPSV